MILPNEIKTKNKIRDAKILQLYLRDRLTQAEIGSRFGISTTRVGQIIYKNGHLLNFHKPAEKVVRVNHLKRMLDNHPDTIGKKSTIDILEQLRKEVEGDKATEINVGVGVTIMPAIKIEEKELRFNLGH